VVILSESYAQAEFGDLPWHDRSRLRKSLRFCTSVFGAVTDALLDPVDKKALVFFHKEETAEKAAVAGWCKGVDGDPWHVQVPTPLQYTSIVCPERAGEAQRALALAAAAADCRQSVQGGMDLARREALATQDGEEREQDWMLSVYGELPDAALELCIRTLADDLGLMFRPGFAPALRRGDDFARVFVSFSGVQERLVNLGATLFQGVRVSLQPARGKRAKGVGKVKPT
jgi:hypothetical protein